MFWFERLPTEQLKGAQCGWVSSVLIVIHLSTYISIVERGILDIVSLMLSVIFSERADFQLKGTVQLQG